MKTFTRILLAAALLLSLQACKDDNEKEDTPAFSVSPATGTITFSAKATESYTFTVTTNQYPWRAVSDQDWCRVSPASDGTTFTVTARENDDTSPPQPATITVTAGDMEPLTIAATQAGAEYSVYVGGYYYGSAQSTPYYWKDGELINLDGLEGSTISPTCYSVAVSNGKVYAAGYLSRREPYYWADGVLVALSTPEDKVIVAPASKAIEVSDGKVYIGGQYFINDNGVGHRVACYWIDGVHTGLTNPAGVLRAEVDDMTVSNGRVYLVGNYLHEGLSRPCYWADGTSVILDIPEGMNGYGTGIAVSEGTIYVGGYYQTGDTDYIACYWVNGVRTDLIKEGASTYINAIAFSNGKLYAAGSNRFTGVEFTPCYWVDGVCTDLDYPKEAYVSSIAYDIVVAGESIYIGGECDKTNRPEACYWVNGECTVLDFPEGVSASYGNSIAIEKK